MGTTATRAPELPPNFLISSRGAKRDPAREIPESSFRLPGLTLDALLNPSLCPQDLGTLAGYPYTTSGKSRPSRMD